MLQDMLYEIVYYSGICKESLGTAGLQVCRLKIRWPGVLSPSQASGLVAEKGRVEGCTSREDTTLASNDPSCCRVKDPHTERNSKKAQKIDKFHARTRFGSYCHDTDPLYSIPVAGRPAAAQRTAQPKARPHPPKGMVTSRWG